MNKQYKSIFFDFLLKISIFAVFLYLSFQGIIILGEKYDKYAIFFSSIWIVIILFSLISIIVDFITQLCLRFFKKKVSFYLKITIITVIISICLYFVSRSINNAYNTADRLRTKAYELKAEFNKLKIETEGQLSTSYKKNGRQDLEYVVQDGDNLWDISLKYYTSGFDWSKISSRNQLENPRLIYPNQVLYIPQ